MWVVVPIAENVVRAIQTSMHSALFSLAIAQSACHANDIFSEEDFLATYNTNNSPCRQFVLPMACFRLALTVRCGAFPTRFELQ
jgi:cob(I)alamin adenosyltransferase